jgi:hypothetical protein
LWVIDAERLETRIHLHPGKDGYAKVEKFASGRVLTPGFASEFAVQLSGLELV